MKVSFSGIYDIRFPAGTSKTAIENKYQQTQQIVKEKFTKDDFSIFDVRKMDYFDSQKTDMKLEKEGIRISTPIDNPWNLCELFDSMDKNLGQQYVNKAKVELILNA